jgi:hypothetical protein
VEGYQKDCSLPFQNKVIHAEHTSVEFNLLPYVQIIVKLFILIKEEDRPKSNYDASSVFVAVVDMCWEKRKNEWNGGEIEREKETE